MPEDDGTERGIEMTGGEAPMQRLAPEFTEDSLEEERVYRVSSGTSATAWSKRAILGIVGGVLALVVVFVVLSLSINWHNDLGAVDAKGRLIWNPLRPEDRLLEGKSIELERLETSVSAQHYDLHFLVDLRTLHFELHQELRFATSQQRETLRVHSRDLQFTRVEIDGDSRVQVTCYTAPVHACDLKPSQALEPGEHLLQLEARAPLSDSLSGLYRASYTLGGHEHVIATTQFEAADARRAFVCFDEPSFKATFDIHVTTQKRMPALQLSVPEHVGRNVTATQLAIKEAGETLRFATTWPARDEAQDAADEFDQSLREVVALSNAQVHVLEDTADRPGWQTWHYRRTPPMSTYLVALVISNFDYIESTQHEHKVRVFAPADRVDQAKWALEVAWRCVRYLTTLLDVDALAQLHKLDLVAVPDFDAGAMENWGLVTFRDTALLFDALDGTAAEQQRVAVVVAHELAHQWFGNLVTLQWWNDLFLNEGFASFFELDALQSLAMTREQLQSATKESLDAQYPLSDGWRLFDHFVLEKRQALYLDAKSATHALSSPVSEIKSAAQASSLFDSVSYDKGALVLLMTQKSTSRASFLGALRVYLKRHQFGNVNSTDFEHAVTSPVLFDFVQQAGCPVLHFGTLYDESDNRVSVVQHRIYDAQSSKQDDTQWTVPVQYPRGSQRLVPKAPVSVLQLSDTPGDSVLFNSTNGGDSLVLESGAFRATFDANLRQQLLKNFAGFSSQQQTFVLDDFFAIGMSAMPDFGYSPTLALEVSEVAFAMLASRSMAYKPRDYAVFETLSSALRDLSLLLDPLQPSLIHEYFTARLYESDYALRTEADLFASLIPSDLPSEYDSVDIATFINTGRDRHEERLYRYALVRTLILLSVPEVIENGAQRLKQRDTLDAEQRGLVLLCATQQQNATLRSDAFATLLRDYPAATASEQRRIAHALALVSDSEHVETLLNWALTDRVRDQDRSTFFELLATYNRAHRYQAFDFLRRHWTTLCERFCHQSFTMARLIERTTSWFHTPQLLDEFDAFFSDKGLGAGATAKDRARESIERNIRWRSLWRDIVNEWLVSALQTS
ncbi:MAG: hypothetical protein MHM6MM_005777 [Cercozoa sp. M6MM]